MFLRLKTGKNEGVGKPYKMGIQKMKIAKLGVNCRGVRNWRYEKSLRRFSKVSGLRMRCKHVIGWFSMKDKLWMDMLGSGCVRGWMCWNWMRWNWMC